MEVENYPNSTNILERPIFHWTMMEEEYVNSTQVLIRQFQRDPGWLYNFYKWFEETTQPDEFHGNA